MNKIFLFCLSFILILPGRSEAQVVELTLNAEIGCSYYGEETFDEVVYGFNNSQEADDEVRRILNVVGLPQNFQIKAANVPNAMATIRDGDRYILYSQQFMNELHSRAGNHWSKVAILAHEIGHHLIGHTLKGTGSRPTLELEADQWSGFVLRKMGADLTEAQSAIRVAASVRGSSTHPGRNARLEAIAVGYQSAGEQEGAATVPDRTPRQGVDDFSNRKTERYPTSVTDPDGNQYPLLRIRGLTWLGKNLNYATKQSTCYQKELGNCQTYGHLYTFEDAKRACMDLGPGWRLPTDAEWMSMVTYYGGYKAGNDGAETGDAQKSYRALIQGGSSGMDFLFAGGSDKDFQTFYGIEEYGDYWTSTPHGAEEAWGYFFQKPYSRTVRLAFPRERAFACRCVRD